MHLIPESFLRCIYGPAHFGNFYENTNYFEIYDYLKTLKNGV